MSHGPDRRCPPLFAAPSLGRPPQPPGRRPVARLIATAHPALAQSLPWASLAASASLRLALGLAVGVLLPRLATADRLHSSRAAA